MPLSASTLPWYRIRPDKGEHRAWLGSEVDDVSPVSVIHEPAPAMGRQERTDSGFMAPLPLPVTTVLPKPSPCFGSELVHSRPAHRSTRLDSGFEEGLGAPELSRTVK